MLSVPNVSISFPFLLVKQQRRRGREKAVTKILPWVTYQKLALL